MNTCDLCFEDTRNQRRNERGDLLCNCCRAYDQRLRSMTPEQLRAEDDMIARHVSESAGV